MDIAQNAPDTVILAEDEASLYLQATQNREWAPCGHPPIVRVAAGREHSHLYGALDLRTGQETAMESPVMNAIATVLFLHMLLTRYPDRPILLLWDRGPWHKGQKIRDLLAAHPRLQILCFPPGCPDLNPQEHVWKDTRQAVSHNHTFAKLPALMSAFLTHLRSKCFPCTLLHQLDFQRVVALTSAFSF